ncbi:hypothetical protein KAU19_03750 [Candidatus Parcubacteria bacterium]|nr:hypothetical protein [Candidatus Parcubacteria bacterium]
MALAATHIRFALDLKDNYKIKDINKYLSGTIYPDSRYITKIDRELTHNNYFLDPEFAKDDFRKGWQAHQICDLIQNQVRFELLPELNIRPKAEWTEEIWIIATTTKIIQDIKDMQCFNLQKYLKCLEYVHNPNNEDINDIKKYNQIIIDLYKNKRITSVEDNYQMCLAFGVNKEIGLKVKKRTEEILENKELVKIIESIYGEMLKSYSKVLI